MEKSRDKFQSNVLDDKLGYIGGIYNDMADVALNYMNRLIWDNSPGYDPKNEKDLHVIRPRVGVLTGITLTEAFNIAIEYCAAMKAFEKYVYEIHYPTNITKLGLAFDQKEYYDNIDEAKKNIQSN